MRSRFFKMSSGGASMREVLKRLPLGCAGFPADAAAEEDVTVDEEVAPAAVAAALLLLLAEAVEDGAVVLLEEMVAFVTVDAVDGAEDSIADATDEAVAEDAEEDAAAAVDDKVKAAATVLVEPALADPSAAGTGVTLKRPLTAGASTALGPLLVTLVTRKRDVGVDVMAWGAGKACANTEAPTVDTGCIASAVGVVRAVPLLLVAVAVGVVARLLDKLLWTSEMAEAPRVPIGEPLVATDSPCTPTAAIEGTELDFTSRPMEPMPSGETRAEETECCVRVTDDCCSSLSVTAT